MSARLFVGNLPFDVTEAELRELFAPVGNLSYVFLPVDRESGKRRGFAFVEFDDEAQAGEALRRFNEQQFRGRSLAVSEARARESRPPVGTPFRPRSPRLPDSLDGPAIGDPGMRRERRGRDDAKRHSKPGSRSTRFEAPGKRGPRRERVGGRLFGLDADEVEELEDSIDDEET